jgi:hypothetical protein
MKARILIFATLTGGAMSLLAGVPVAANLVWCVADPPLQVATAGGHNLTVNTTVYLDKGSVNLKNDVEETATAAPDGEGGTLITVQVYLPAGVGSAYVVSSLNRYKVSATGTGAGGEVITLYLDAPTD